jgi:hypothetical protein
MKKCIHLRYDPDLDEFVLVGMDGRSMGNYTNDYPADLLKILMAETIIQNEVDQEVRLGMKGE